MLASDRNVLSWSKPAASHPNLESAPIKGWMPSGYLSAYGATIGITYFEVSLDSLPEVPRARINEHEALLGGALDAQAIFGFVRTTCRLSKPSHETPVQCGGAALTSDEPCGAWSRQQPKSRGTVKLC